MMLIIDLQGFQSPDGTSFNRKAAQPELELDEQGVQVLKLVNGTGRRRSSWGNPGVTSTVIVQDEDFVSIHVGFYHKYGGDQFYRHYVQSQDGYKQVTWARLSDDLRARVIDACADRAPAWAEAPGKMRQDRKPAETKTLISYKIVQVKDGHYYSVYDPDVEYLLNKRLAEKVVTGHGGGYYSFPHLEGLLSRFENQSLFPEQCFDQPMSLAVLKCEISGKVLTYGEKYASTYLRPIEVLNTFDYTPAGEQVAS